MITLGTKLRAEEGAGAGRIHFWCPGCNHSHVVSANSGVPGRDWQFNGNGDAPTFSPSVLITTGHYMSSHKQGDDCWCTFNRKYPGRASFGCSRCHSFVTDGMIQFLGDCTHALAGQTVPLPDYPAGESQ
jgi:hypothetical protein